MKRYQTKPDPETGMALILVLAIVTLMLLSCAGGALIGRAL